MHFQLSSGMTPVSTSASSTYFFALLMLSLSRLMSGSTHVKLTVTGGRMGLSLAALMAHATASWASFFAFAPLYGFARQAPT